MKEIEFNLLDEPWIRVMKPNCSVVEVSLTDALLHAHEYEDLAGELPTQDIAVLRVLLAVLHTVFSRVDPKGNPDLLDEENALERWSELWNAKKFPEKPIRDYLEQWHERFWLFHPERPFFQVPEAKCGSYYSAAKLNGEISESANKVRIFSSRSGSSKKNLYYQEAIRWLIHLNGFDDTSVKTNTGTGSGWLGKLGLIIAKGTNLFETFMLNLIFLKNGNKEWQPDLPVWELERSKTTDKNEIPQPNNMAELYTLQSRRILLIRDNEYVSGFYSMGGDYFDEKNAGNEQMTLWKVQLNSRGDRIGIEPFRHDFSKQVWRNFSLIASQKVSFQKPGVVLWINNLIDEQIISKNTYIHFYFAAVKYDPKGQSLFDYFSDYLNIHVNLFSDKGKRWISYIEEEILFIDKIADLIWQLANNIMLASGSKNSSQASYQKELFYYRINESFRLWLARLSSDQSPKEIIHLCNEWHTMAIKIAKGVGSELVDKSGPQAFAGKKIKEDNKEQERFYSTPEAYYIFSVRLNHIYDSKGA